MTEHDDGVGGGTWTVLPAALATDVGTGLRRPFALVIGAGMQ